MVVSETIEDMVTKAFWYFELKLERLLTVVRPISISGRSNNRAVHSQLARKVATDTVTDKGSICGWKTTRTTSTSRGDDDRNKRDVEKDTKKLP
jgi:hypothetical protein